MEDIMYNFSPIKYNLTTSSNGDSNKIRGVEPAHSTPIKHEEGDNHKVTKPNKEHPLAAIRKNLSTMLDECDNTHQILEDSSSSHLRPHSQNSGKSEIFDLFSKSQDLSGTNVIDSRRNSRNFMRSGTNGFHTNASKGSNGCGSKISTASDFESSTIQKQRKELQLLIGELKERDRELNEMVSAHNSQLSAWENDRQRLLILEQKTASLEYEMRGKNDQIRGLVKKIRIVESEEHSKSAALDNTRQQLVKVTEQHSRANLKVKDIQEKNKNLSKSLRDLSGRLGQLEAKEQELVTLLSLKDKDLSNASNQASELAAKVKQLDLQYKESQKSELEAHKQTAQWKNRHTECEAEVNRLRENLNKSQQEEESFQVEKHSFIQESNALKKQLEIAGEREKRKDELIECQRQKQERNDGELTSVRQLYDRQQRDLSLLHLNLEATRELLAKQQAYGLDDSLLNGEALDTLSTISVPDTSYHSVTYSGAIKCTSQQSGTISPASTHDSSPSPGWLRQIFQDKSPENLKPLRMTISSPLSPSRGVSYDSSHSHVPDSTKTEEDLKQTTTGHSNHSSLTISSTHESLTYTNSKENEFYQNERYQKISEEREQDEQEKKEREQDEQERANNGNIAVTHTTPASPPESSSTQKEGRDSPTSKLERLLTESQQMVESLEKSMNSSKNSGHNDTKVSQNTTQIGDRTTDGEFLEEYKPQ